MGVQIKSEKNYSIAIIGAGLDALCVISRLPNELLKELKQVAGGQSPTPTAALLEKFCKERIIGNLPESLHGILKDTVVSIKPRGTSGDGSGSGSSNAPVPGPSSCLIHLSSGNVISCQAIIVTCSNAQPVVPKWAKILLKAGKTEAEKEEKLNGAQDSLGIQTWDKIRLRAISTGLNPGINEKNILIVGGGMTAATLALGAVKAGAAGVTLVARRPLLQRQFPCEVGWWGNKRLNAFWQENEPEKRLKMCRQARQQASLNPETWTALAEAVGAGKISVVECLQVESAKRVESTPGKDSPQWEVQLHPTLEPVTPQQQQCTAFQAAVAALKLPSTHDAASPSPSSPIPTSLTADLIWLACGSAFNTAAHSVLSSVQATWPTRLVGGYPVVDFGSCVWPGAPVYVVGRGAELAVGPAAGELAGMRLAAERVVVSLKKLNYAGKREWESAAETLAVQLKPPAPTTPQPSGASGVGTVQPTSALENYLALEEEGLMCFERRIRSSVARPLHLVDISDLPSNLPRHELQKFSFSEEDFEICLTLVLPEGVLLENVRSLITEWSLEIWAIGVEGAYRLHVPRLYGRILPSRCKIKVNQSKKKVFILLHKEKDAEWCFLKGA